MKYQNKILFSLLAFVLALFLSSPLFAQTPPSDTVLPSDVENVRANPGDAKISLSWDVATDNEEVTGYKIFYGTNSVRNEGEEYNLGVMNVEDVVTHTVENLRNGVAYYFAVVAVDSNGNESENYSLEVSATPAPGLSVSSVEDDGKSPEVLEAKALTADSVKITFSEAVVLALESPEHSFTIKKQEDGSALNVKRADLDPTDETNHSVLVLTDPQESEVLYRVTVDQLVTDFYENAVVKDTKDSVEFKGFKAEEVAEAQTQATEVAPQPPLLPAAPEDEEGPKVVSTTAESSNRIRVDFSEEMVFDENPLENFSIHEKDDEDKELKMVNANFSVDKKTVYIITFPQEDKEYRVEFEGLEDLAGNELDTDVLDENPAPAVFHGIASSILDLLPPEDVTELLAQLVDIQTAAVTLSWQPSKNSAGDLADQMLYQSLDRGKNYDAGKSLGKDATSVKLEKLRSGREYTWKVTVKDQTGNESVGTTVTLFLPKTGPALPVLLAISISVGYYLRRRRKNK